MPTLLSHPAVPLALGLAIGASRVSPRLLCAGVVASVIPDLDVVGFNFGISYSDILGHRGLTHSLGFALLPGSPGVDFRQLVAHNPRSRPALRLRRNGVAWPARHADEWRARHRAVVAVFR